MSGITRTLENGFKKLPEIGKIYQHYKGGKYQVLTLAEHTESKEDLVIYRSLHYGSTHARPLSNWNDVIEVEGETFPINRFKLEA